MIEREEYIERQMNYCQHYSVSRNKGIEIKCNKGVVIREIGIRNLPCVYGPGDCRNCEKYEQTPREKAEASHDDWQKVIEKVVVVLPFLSEWKKKTVKDKQYLVYGRYESVRCPVCEGKLHINQSSYNDHVHAKCETKDCVSIME